mgnify:CR=1 FL=1
MARVFLFALAAAGYALKSSAAATARDALYSRARNGDSQAKSPSEARRPSI